MKNIKLVLLGIALIISLSSASLVYADPVDTTNDSSSCVSLSNNLKYKATDARTNGDVTTLQEFLATGGYLTTDPTGYFNLATKNAVIRFQSSNGLATDGSVGPITRAKLNALYGGCGDTTTGWGVGSSNSNLGSIPGCNNGTVGYSTISGVSCANNNIVVFSLSPSSTVPGCTSTTGYSPTTGQACTGSGITSSTQAIEASFNQERSTLAGSTISDKTTAKFTFLLKTSNESDLTLTKLVFNVNGAAASSIQVGDNSDSSLFIKGLPVVAVVNGTATVYLTTSVSRNALLYVPVHVYYVAGSANSSASSNITLASVSYVSNTTGVAGTINPNVSSSTITVTGAPSSTVPGCTSTTGYSPTTGQACSGTPPAASNFNVVWPAAGSVLKDTDPLVISWTPYSGTFDQYNVFLGNSLTSLSLNVNPDMTISKSTQTIFITATRLAAVMNGVSVNSGKTLNELKNNWVVSVRAFKTSSPYEDGVYARSSTFTITPSGAVTPPPVAQNCVINSFTADPTTVTAGQPSKLSWSTSNCTIVRLSTSEGSTSSYLNMSGETSSYATSTTTYILTASNSTGTSVTKSVTITVTPPVVVATPPPTIKTLITGTQGVPGYTNGAAVAGQYVALYGTFSPSGNSVTINGSPASISYESATQINVAVPTTVTGYATFIVTNSLGTSNASTVVITAPSSQGASALWSLYHL